MHDYAQSYQNNFTVHKLQSQLVKVIESINYEQSPCHHHQFYLLKQLFWPDVLLAATSL